MKQSHNLIISGYADAETPGVHLVALASDKTFSEQAKTAGLENPSFVAVHPNGSWLYAVSEGDAGEVWSLKIDPDTHLITRVNSQPSGGDAPCHLTINASGKWLIVANYTSGTIGVLPITADGGLGALADRVQHEGKGADPERQDAAHAHSTQFTPDQKFVIAADLGADMLFTYAFDSATGKLSPHQQTPSKTGAGPRHMAWHPNGQILYVANELDNTVGVYAYDTDEATLTAGQVISTLPDDAPKSTTADIHITQAGDYLYVSNRGHDSIATFTIAEDGDLTLAAIQPCGGKEPRNFAITPDEAYLLVANQSSNTVVLLPRNGDDGVGAVEGQWDVQSPSCVKWLPTA
jgi:6-phosphogluconolactonase